VRGVVLPAAICYWLGTPEHGDLVSILVDKTIFAKSSPAWAIGTGDVHKWEVLARTDPHHRKESERPRH